MPDARSSPNARLRGVSQAALRNAGRAARKAMSIADRDLASEKIAESVMHAAWFRSARTLAAYLPMHDEVDTWPVIARAWQMKKRIFVPVIEKKNVMQFRELLPSSELFPNRFGFSAPHDGALIAPRQLDLVLTPLVSFDHNRNRIGMGGGYYDRTFSFLRHRRHLLRPKLVGVAFACQQAEEIAANPWDIRLFRVIHESP